MKYTSANVFCLAVVLLLAACGKTNPPATSAATSSAPASTAAAADSSRPKHIAWFEGDVTAALAAAAQSKKHVLLYWGAAWCPPCHLLKATVFADPRFIEKSQLFVPVYLDGDEPGAQKWGEHFRISGYPTMLVLTADQKEIARISGGMDLQQYANLLDQALLDARPVAAVLATLESGRAGDALKDSCRRVAWNAWGLDDGLNGGDPLLARRLAAAADICGRDDASLGLRLQVFAAVANGAGAARAGTPIDPAMVAALTSQLATPATAAAQYDALRYLAPDFFKGLATQNAGAAKQLADRYVEAMLQAADDARFTRADQLGGVYAALLARTALGGKGDATLLARARQRVARELTTLPDDPWLRTGVVTGVLEVMDALGDHAAAYHLARRESATAHYGYYFMATLADICEHLGRPNEALQWYETAYRQARGSATRVQWGTSHVQALLRLRPEATDRIQRATLDVIGELKGTEGVFRRSRMRIESLDRQLRQWAEADSAQRAPVLRHLSAEYARACPKDCTAFLASPKA
jgi:protein disulfide-isomerase